ncbi:putative L,D-transpeptidase [Vibrio ezurae NBRC 102218]|uniref:Putative L,D-transpeptidase n=1 Tax=Vibrio ezurae NBRC 102218 TaxID=1219080 RepID=U3AZL4_9VIBR|nr:putative L,D-transpeptidase [Vibrio ezurae NBRC 102218]
MLWSILVACCTFSTPTYSQSMFHTLGWVNSSVPIEQAFRYPHLTEALYRSNRHQLIWLQSQDRQLFENLIENVVLADISPFFNQRFQHLQHLRITEQHYQYDLAATDLLLAFLSYRALLKENKYTWLYGDGLPDNWAEPPPDVVERLQLSVANGTLTPYLEGMGVALSVYQEYQYSIQMLKSKLRDDIAPYPEQLVRVGDTLPDRQVLFSRLAMAGLVVPDPILQQTWYGKELRGVVKRFQRQHGLKADGVIGPDTAKWLNYPIEERIRRLALNAERSHLWPVQRKALVLVNLPSFELHYYFNNKVVFSSKVIVGKQQRKTPLLEIKMDSLVLNPTWNVPPKIMREDIIPILRYNPGYLNKKGIQVIKGWGNPVIIDHGAIQWRKVNAKKFPFRMRQLSGQANALGVYKFNTPNQRAIYLHDTPAKYLFDKSSRAFSSGCIRVQHADKFAHSISKTQGFKKRNISPQGQQSNARIPLKRRLPVHLIYKTSWVESGRVFFREDVYGYDAKANRADLALKQK